MMPKRIAAPKMPTAKPCSDSRPICCNESPNELQISPCAVTKWPGVEPQEIAFRNVSAASEPSLV